MNILVTGAAGFIGSHLAEKLHSLKHNVIGFDNFSDYYDVGQKRANADILRAKGISIIEADLREETGLLAIPPDVQYIFHCAGQPGIASKSRFEDYLGNNFIATYRLIEFAKSILNLTMFVNIGTSSIYGVDVCCDEETIAKPVSNYGVTKLAAEQLVLASSRLGHFPACSLRLYSVYGSRERPDKMFSQLIDCACNHKVFPLFMGSLAHKRSFTHITDIINGIVSVLGKETECHHQIINLGTDKEYTTEEGIKVVELLLNTKIAISHHPERSGDQVRTKAVIGKARRLLDYKPHIGLEEGVAEQIAAFKKRMP